MDFLRKFMRKGTKLKRNEWFQICPKGNWNNIRPSRPDIVCVSRTSGARGRLLNTIELKIISSNGINLHQLNWRRTRFLSYTKTCLNNYCHNINVKEEEIPWKSKNLQECITLMEPWTKRRASSLLWPPCWRPGAAPERLRASRPRSKPAPVVKNYPRRFTLRCEPGLERFGQPSKTALTAQKAKSSNSNRVTKHRNDN